MQTTNSDYVSIEGQGHFFTIYFPGFVCFVLYLAKISGERLQDHWSSGLSTSIPSERIFSAAGLLINKLRNRLSSDIIDSIISFNQK